ncbi:MAG: sensor histidine kinase [Sinobacteraceae bacterium]|nr:sensor histidine kinase [Nevskiaceae bacterium]
MNADSGASPAGETADAASRRVTTVLFEHRRQTRSLLAMIRAIIRHMVQSYPAAEEYAAVLEDRVAALARVQEMLMRGPQATAELTEVVVAELMAQAIPERQVTVTGPETQLANRVAATLALALHELCSNTIKFGALIVPDGHIDVHWTEVNADGVLRLEWDERGAFEAHGDSQFQGFGRELLERTLPYELSARTELQIRPGRVHFLAEFRPGGPR